MSLQLLVPSRAVKKEELCAGTSLEANFQTIDANFSAGQSFLLGRLVASSYFKFAIHGRCE